MERLDEPLFSDLSFVVDAGRALRLSGRNGAGKTTLLRILCGLTPPTAGDVRWCGEALQRCYPDFVADLCYVGHVPGLKGDLNPVENLLFHTAGRAASGVSPEAALARVGLPPECEETPCRRLSAGQQRRVALARLLLTRARLWILDEPFTALDPEGRGRVEALLGEHLRGGGLAVVTTHHHMELESDRVVVLELDDGQ